MDFENRGTVRRTLLDTGKRQSDIPHGVEVDYVIAHCQSGGVAQISGEIRNSYEDTLEVNTQWVRNKMAVFSSRSKEEAGKCGKVLTL